MSLPFVRFLKAALLAAVVTAGASSLASAAEAPAAAAPAAGAGAAGGAQSCGSQDFVKQTMADESNGGDYGIENTKGYLGAYQIGEAKLQDMKYAVPDGNAYDNKFAWTGKDGITSKEAFFANTKVQDEMFWKIKAIDWAAAKRIGLDKYIGKTLPDGTLITESSILHGCHLTCGGAKAYFDSGMSCGSGTKDAYGTCAEKYLRSGSGFDVSGITGSGGAGICKAPEGSTKYAGDETSRTCPPTVAMLQAIPCMSYPAALMPFCFKYKPLQMNMAECQAAEKYAKSVPPSGPQLDACKQQTFGNGTGSWSYVLACAKAQPAQGNVGESKKSLGAADDPACYERLKGMGLEIEEKGKIDVSTGGRTCIIPNATGWSGGTVKLSQKVTLNCALVEQLEEFSKAAVGMGITRMEVLGTISCRGINNTKGTNQSKTSLHGTGNAIDINAFTIGGASVPTSRYFTNAASRTFFDGMIQLGCSKFDGTLAFRFYKKKWTHVHWQATEKTNCDPNG